MNAIRRTLIALTLVAGVLAAPRAEASHPFFVFEKGPVDMLSPQYQTWQTRFEDEGDYGESWFFVLQTEDEGFLFALLSVTNLGLRTFGGVVSVQWYPPEGDPVTFHREVTRQHVSASPDSMDVSVGPGRTWGGGRRYQVEIDDPDMKLSLDFRGALPGYQFGGGRVEFYEDRRSEWSIAFNSPRAGVTGSLQAGGKTWELKGIGYHDHGWSTIKMPTFAKSWHTMRVFHETYTVIMHRILLQDRFGGGFISMGILGKDGKIVGSTRRLTYHPTATRRDRPSGYRVPTEASFKMAAGGYTVEGKTTEARFLDSVDVLGQLSWPVRTAIRAFYSKPYMLRYVGAYEFEVTRPDGEKETVAGRALMEANYF